MPEREQDKQLLAQYAWSSYRSMPAMFQPQIESCLLMQLVLQSPKTLNQDYAQWQACTTLLTTDTSLKQLLLECWEVGSFDRVRKLAILQSSQGSVSEPQATVIHYGSTFTEVHGNAYWNLEDSARRRIKIMKWFSKIDYGPIQKDTHARRADATCNWFLESPNLKEWLENDKKRILWCPGMPGVGKTVISSLVVYHLEELQKLPVCVTFLNYKRRSQQSLSHILRTILRQLYELYEPAMDSIEDFHRFHSVRSHPTVPDLLKAVLDASVYPDHIYVVLDGLDEYLDTYSDEAITSLRDSLMSIPNVKIMITSRIIGNMENIFAGEQVIRQEIYSSEKDIQGYIEDRISKEIPKKYQRDMKDTIRDRVIKVAKQRFLLVKLHMDLITSRLTLGEMRDALNTLSEEVDHVYRQAIERIDQQGPRQRELARNILMWVACTHRQLTVKELQHALAAAPGRQNINDYLYEVELLTSICAGLIIINKELRIVQLVHYTAQEFFGRTRDTYFPDADSKIVASLNHYLNIEPGPYDHAPSNVFTMFDSLPLYRYISEHLPQHLQSSGETLISGEQRLTRLKGGFRLLTTICAVDGHYPLVRWRWPNWEAIHFAAAMGVVSLIRDIFELDPTKVDLRCKETGFTPILCAVRAANIESIRYLFSLDVVNHNDREMNGNSLLAIAARHGHNDVIDFLLNIEDVDVNSTNNNGRTPLHEAVMYDRLHVFTRLMAHPSVSVNAQDKSLESPLFLAVRYRQEGMTSTLLEDPRVDYTLVNSRGQTPLALAVAEGFDTMVEILLRKDALAMDFRDDTGRSHLSWAAENGMTEIAEIILGLPDCPVDSPDDDGRTPLYYACSHGHIEVLRLLLTIPQVNPDAADVDGQTPLYTACSSGHLEIVKALLDTGRVDPDHPINDGMTPLAVSSRWGRTSILQRLLREKVDPDSRDKRGRTPLSYAAENGYRSNVEILLRAGSAVEGRDEGGITPFSWCISDWREHIETAKVLLDAGADVNTQDNGGQTPLMRFLRGAITYGRHRPVQFLLDHGADVNLVDEQGRNALWHAVGEWFEDFVNLLLPHTINIELPDKNGCTPLMRAANKGAFSSLQLLISKGSNVNAVDAQGRSALFYASACGHLDKDDHDWLGSFEREVTCLLGNGVDVNLVDNEGRKAMDYAWTSQVAQLIFNHGGTRSEQPPLERWKWIKVEGMNQEGFDGNI